MAVFDSDDTHTCHDDDYNSNNGFVCYNYSLLLTIKQENLKIPNSRKNTSFENRDGIIMLT